MSSKNRGLITCLVEKHLKDNFILGCISILIVADIIFVKDKTTMVLVAIVALFAYFIQYQFSRHELTKSMNSLVDNELREFQKVSVNLLQLSEKQKQLTNKYVETLHNALQTAKAFQYVTMNTKDKTQQMTSKIQETYELSNKELKTLVDNIESIKILKQKIQAIAELIIELTDYVKQIGSTVSIVENISEQTNMLALNAAVEAARAGEYGKGFSVVAGEIRKLADESKQATNKITTLVSEIEQTTSSTIIATEEGAKEVEYDVKNSLEIQSDISSIVTKIKEIGAETNSVLSAAIEQQAVTNDVLETMENMQRSISETVNTLEENIQNIRMFSEISTNIKDNIAG